ncbi:hypothetical protein [Streptomyces lannensis]|uniref:Uncharacterized protein n=1 Tax=Streptomyces lannensis TaxID=766498 RepID=A0ABP7LQ16_9ACTN
MTKQLQEVQDEQARLVIAERVLNWLAELAYELGAGLSSLNCQCLLIER